MTLEDFANSLTSEQYASLLDIVCPLTKKEKNMTVDELYSELTEV